MSAPNLFIVGLMRAGTTAMTEWLSWHPDIFVSPVKEPSYFGRDLRSRRPRIAWGDYLALFAPGARNRYRLDASVMSLISATAASEIKAVVPDAKILIHLREPYGWLESAYTLGRLFGNDWADPDTAALRRFNAYDARYFNDRWCFEGNFYIDQYLTLPERIEEYRTLFGAEHVRIVFFDDLKQDARATVDGVLRWLGLECGLLPAGYDSGIVNSTEELKRTCKPNSRLMLHVDARLGSSFLYRVYARPMGRSEEALSRLLRIPARAWSGLYGAMPKILFYLRSAPAADVTFMLSPSVRRQLEHELESVLDRLEALTGRDLVHWRSGRRHEAC